MDAPVHKQKAHAAPLWLIEGDACSPLDAVLASVAPLDACSPLDAVLGSAQFLVNYLESLGNLRLKPADVEGEVLED